MRADEDWPLGPLALEREEKKLPLDPLDDELPEPEELEDELPPDPDPDEDELPPDPDEDPDEDEDPDGEPRLAW